MIVELEPGVYCAEDGDPPYTMVKKYAKDFDTMHEAMAALAAARKIRPFENAVIEEDFL